MFTHEDHALLAQTGPRTPMGTLLRRYWIPAVLSEEVPVPDCAPVRVRLMGESLIAFRNSAGQAGLIGEHCSHRGASLYLGRNADGGLRCSNHGWKYDVSGVIVETPNSLDDRIRRQIRHPAHPCKEVGGLVWAYMGPADHMPPLPDLEWSAVPETHRYVSKRLQECHWLQALEVDIDSSHVPWLHREAILARAEVDEKARWFRDGTEPAFDLREREYGVVAGARRDAGIEHYYWRINQWLVPWYTMTPSEGGPSPYAMHGWVPIDDTTTWVYSFTWHPDRPLSEQELAGYRSGTAGIYLELVPGTYRPKRNPSNEWEMDREAQRRGELWTGIRGNQEQDNAITESMGRAYDRTKEHLVGPDAFIMATRRYLLNAARQLPQGTEPVSARGRGFRVHPVSKVLPRSASWFDEVRSLIELGPAART